MCARKCIVFREEETYLGDGPSFAGARREIMKVEQIICSQLFFDTFRDVATSIIHPAKTKEKKQRQDKALCFLSELYSLSDTPLAYRPGDKKSGHSKCDWLKPSSAYSSSSAAPAASYATPVFQHSVVASATVMLKQVNSTLIQAPGLGPKYNYFDGEVTVYGRKGKKGDFVPDPKFTPQLVAAIKKELINGLRTGQRTSAWECIVQMAMDAGIAWKQQVLPAHAGAHPDNRGSFGLDAIHSQDLGNDITKVGWSWKKSADSSCIQAPPEPWAQFCIDSNDRLADLSGDLIPHLAQLEVLTMGGGHTNCFLRQVLAGVRALHPELADKHGRLNKQHLCIDRPAFKDALEMGITFICFHWQVPFFFPALPDFAQGALNVVVAGGQGEIEILQTLHNLAQIAMTSAQPGEKLDWGPIESTVCQTMPSCKGWIRHMSTFVEQNSGGPGGELLAELSDYAKAFQGPDGGLKRIIGGEMFEKLNSLNFGKGVKFPFLKIAILEAVLASPADKVQSGMCKLVLPSMLNDLLKKDKRAAIEKVESVFAEARAICKGLGLSQSDRIKHVGLLDVRLCLHLVKRGKDFESRNFASVDEIVQVRPPTTHNTCAHTGGNPHAHTHTHASHIHAHKLPAYAHASGCFFFSPQSQVFLKELSKCVGQVITFGSDAASADGSSAASGSTDPSPAQIADGLETVEQMRNSVFQARKAGFEVDAFVCAIDTDEVAVSKIVKYTGTRVTLQQQVLGANSGEPVTIEADQLLAGWRLFKGSVTAVLPLWTDDKSLGDPLASASWKFECAKGAINLAIRSVYESLSPGIHGIDLIIRPNMVKVKDTWPAGEFMLAPATYRLERKEGPTTIPCGKFDLGGATPEPVFISPMFTAIQNAKGEPNKFPWVCPFWHVPQSTKGQKPVLGVKFVQKVIEGYNIKVPVMVNIKDIDESMELNFDRADVKKLLTSRSSVDPSDFVRAAKRRKLA